MKTSATILICLIFGTFNQLHVLDATVPKQVLKHGIMAFIQEISESSENNLCFVVFESWAEAIIDRQASFEEAFDTIFNLDLTHVLAKGNCQNAYNKFTTTVYSRHKSKMQTVAIWAAIKEYVTLVMDDNETFQKNDHCLRFIRHLSSQIVNKENPDLIKTAHPNFVKALLQTGLQYLEDGEEYANVPCVKAMEAMGTYSKEIRGWISQAVAMEPTTDEGLDDYDDDENSGDHDEL